MPKYLDEYGVAHLWSNAKNYIDEKQSSSDGNSDPVYNNIYSTQETVIGQYFGKPLYRICATYKFASNAGQSSSGVNVVLNSVFPNANFQNIRLVYYLVECRQKNGMYLSSFGPDFGFDSTLNGTTVNKYIYLHRATDTAIQNKTAGITFWDGNTKGNFSGCTAYVTLEYTKTTD